MKSIEKILYLIIFTVLMSVSTFQNSLAERNMYGYLGDIKDNGITIGDNGICQTNYQLDYNTTDGGKDYKYDFRNSTCLKWAVTSAVAGLPPEITASISCKNIAKVASFKRKLGLAKMILRGASVTMSTAGGVFTDPILAAHISSGVLGGTCAAMAALAAFDPTVTTCCVSAATAIGIIEGTTLGISDSIHRSAQDSFENVRICGYDWYSYENHKDFKDSKNNYPEFGKNKNSYSFKIKDCLTNSNCSKDLVNGYTDIVTDKSKWNIGNKIYREYIYQGKEFINKDKNCEDPRSSKIKGFTDNYQRYYLKGLEKGNYACNRRFGKHLSEKYSTICGGDGSKKSTDECKKKMEKAYDCCIKKSITNICLRRTDRNINNAFNYALAPNISYFKDFSFFPEPYTFCSKGDENCYLKNKHYVCSKGDENCYLKNKQNVAFSSGNKVKYNIYSSSQKPNMLCAETENLCPFNHKIFGGMETEVNYKCDLEKEDKTSSDCKKVIIDNVPTSSYGKPKNYCQLYANCTYVGTGEKPRIPSLISRFFSPACQDLRGDSLNYIYREKEEKAEAGDIDFWNMFINSVDKDKTTIAIMVVNEVRKEKLNVRDNKNLAAITSIAFSIGGSDFADNLSNFINKNVTDEIYVDNRATIDEFLPFRGISTPIVQCIKETLENMFFNLDGYTKCIEGGEMDKYGNCNCLSNTKPNEEDMCIESSGNYSPYIYKRGRVSKTDLSPFSVIQKRVRGFVRLLMTLSITLIGFKILISGVDLSKFDFKKVSLYLTKFGLIWYFAVGTAWQQHFASAVLNASQEVSTIITKAYYPVITGTCPYGSDRSDSLNRECICKNHQVWNESSESCKCPEYSNLVNGNCEPTIPNMEWDDSGKRFICKDEFGGLNESGTQCICKGNQVIKYEFCGCPDNSSYDDEENGICVCDIGYIWDSNSNSCNLRIPSISINNSILWLDASDLTTITENNGSLIEWRDKNGNGNNAIQNVPDSEPKYNNRQLNSLSTITFDGINDYLQVASSTFPTGAQPSTVIIVTRPLRDSASDVLVDIGELDAVLFVLSNTSNLGVIGGLAYGKGSGQAAGSNLTALNNWVVFSGTSDNSIYKSYINGVLNKTSPSDPTNINSSKITIGSSYVLDQFFSGDIAEIIIYNRVLSDTERQEVEDYLTKKWLSNDSGTATIPLNLFTTINKNSNIATEIGEDVEVDYSSPLYDGCYFDPDDYPAGKGYLSTFDAFDCKIARYLGYGPQVSVPGILVLMIPGLLTAKLGVLFILLSLSFAILIILITIRVVTTFLLSLFAIILLIYISPIIIPLLLFEKTKEIFSSWLKNLIGFIVQPIMLFAYIAVFFNVVEPALLGSAYFEGDTKGGRELVCDRSFNNDMKNFGNAKVDSLLCLFGDHSASAFGSMAQSSGITGIGIGVSVIKDVSKSGEGFFMRLLTIFKGVLLMYLFFTFIDKIPEISAKISGGTALNPSAPGLMSTMKKTLGKMRGAQKFSREATVGTARRVPKIAKRSSQAVRGAMHPLKIANAIRTGLKQKFSRRKRDEGERKRDDDMMFGAAKKD